MSEQLELGSGDIGGEPVAGGSQASTPISGGLTSPSGWRLPRDALLRRPNRGADQDADQHPCMGGSSTSRDFGLYLSSGSRSKPDCDPSSPVHSSFAGESHLSGGSPSHRRYPGRYMLGGRRWDPEKYLSGGSVRRRQEPEPVHNSAATRSGASPERTPRSEGEASGGAVHVTFSPTAGAASARSRPPALFRRGEGDEDDEDAEMDDSTPVRRNRTRKRSRELWKKAGHRAQFIARLSASAKSPLAPAMGHWQANADQWREEYERELHSEVRFVQAPTYEHMSESTATATLSRLALDFSGLAWLRYQARQLVSTELFEIISGMVILANCINIGIDQHNHIKGRSPLFVDVLEHIFIACYMVELFLRCFAHGFAALHDNWVKFDAALVASSVALSWVYPAIVATQSAESGPLTVLRTMRLVRVLRAIRVLYRFRVLWMLLMGLLGSAGTLVYTMVVMLILFYVFGIMGIELIGFNSKNELGGPDFDPEFRELTDVYFCSVRSAMMTLMQFATGDTIGDIYRAYIKKEPALALYFILVIAIVQIALMNLVTGVIVNSAMERANSNREAERVMGLRRKKALIKKAGRLLRRIDEDRSGQISRQEMLDMSDEDFSVLCDILHGCSTEDPMDMFNALDVHGDGLVDIEEFCQHIWKVSSAKVPTEVQRLEKKLAFVFDRTESMQSEHEKMSAELDEMVGALQRIEARWGTVLLDPADEKPGAFQLHGVCDGAPIAPVVEASAGEACTGIGAALRAAGMLSAAPAKDGSMKGPSRVQQILALKDKVKQATDGGQYEEARLLLEQIQGLRSGATADGASRRPSEGLRPRVESM